MLQIYPSVNVKDVPYGGGKQTADYTLFPDTDDPHQYYVLPNTPTFRTTKGEPDFNLTWYYGSGQPTGGFCSFTVCLPFDNTLEFKEKVAQEITKDIPTIDAAKKKLELCRAAAAPTVDAALVARLKKELGIADSVNVKTAIQFDAKKEYDQFLPEVSEIKLSAIPYRSGSVRVAAFPDEKNYQSFIDAGVNNKTGVGETVKGTGVPSVFVVTPSGLNQNAAVISFSLTGLGVNIFWHGLGGPPFSDVPASELPKEYKPAEGGVSAIAVYYDVTFDGMLPSASATVTFKASAVAQLVRKETTQRGAWGQTYTANRVVGKDYVDAVKNSTVLKLPSPEGDKDGKISEMLQAWAKQQLESMVRAQLPDIKLADLKEGDAEKLSRLHDETRSYTLQQGVTVPKQPQAQLRKLPDLVPNPNDLPKYFQKINLNQEPFINVEVGVNQPDLDVLKALKVSSFVVTAISYDGYPLRNKRVPGTEVNTIEFVVPKSGSPAAIEPINLVGRFDKDRALQGALKYGYMVTYGDGTPALTVRDVTLDPRDRRFDLASADLGVLVAKLSGESLPWGILKDAKIEFEYESWKTTETLTETKQTCTIVKPIGRQISGKYRHRLTLNFVSGKPNVGEWKEETPDRNETVSLISPFDDGNFVKTFELDAEVTQKAQLRVQYTIPQEGQPERTFEKLITIPAPAPASTSLTLPKAERPTFKVVRARVGAKDLTSQDEWMSEHVESTITVFNDKLDFGI
jgi:hypothetical protein